MVLSGATPIPTKAVMWINADTPIAITGVVVGQTGSGIVTVSNPGYGPLTITSVTATGDPSLSQTNNCTAAPIAPGASCQVTVNFTPTSAGTFAGTLTIESNTPTRTLAINATSRNPMSEPEILPSQDVLLPDTALGSSSPITIELENYSLATAPLTVSGLTWAGSNPGDFSQTNNCTSPIAVGDSCTINITFTPLALGGRTALLNFTTNGGEIGATVSGTAVTTVTKYAFNMTINGPGTVKQTPTGTSFANNTTITVAATPNANSSFINWGAICPNIAYIPTCTVVLNQNVNASANFAANVTLTTKVVGGGTILQQPTGTSFAPGSVVTLTAAPNQGQNFVSWSPSSACAPTTSLTTCFVTLNANTTITATFTGATNYTLTTNASGPGTIMQSPTGTSFASGTAITLTAVPNSGATFTSWSGGACAGSTNTTCMFNISANTSETATFAVAQYTLTTTASGPGTITQSPTGTSICVGDGDYFDGGAEHGRRVHELVGRCVQRRREHDVRVQHFGEYIGDGDVFKSAGGDDADSIANGRGGRLVYVRAERDRILDDAYVHGKLRDTGGLVHDQRDDAGGDDDGANFGGRASRGGVDRAFEWRRKRASRR